MKPWKILLVYGIAIGLGICLLFVYSVTGSLDKGKLDQMDFFRRHLMTHEAGHRGPISIVSCCICGKDRPNEGEMKAHMKKHRVGKYYRCDICKFQTVQLKKLIQHRRMHTGEKPHLWPFLPLSSCSPRQPSVPCAAHAQTRQYVWRHFHPSFCAVGWSWLSR